MLRTRHLRMASRFMRHRFRALHVYEVQAVLLNACNLKCAYCRCPEILTKVMTTEQWCTIIGGLAKVGTLRIKFQGGEPTLRRDFDELCAASQAHGIITAAVSNGVAIVSKPTLLAHLDELVISLDAARADINDRLRGAGSHDAAVRAIELACQRGVRTYVNM